MPNPNTLYANIFVEKLIRSGLKHVCFVPGSRHTPLILAFAKHKETINIYSHLDERSASFFALGLALALDEPVAMVCTSGSAGANFFPAIIEAHQSRVPLIVLTADRPHELRQSGANQTIDQVKMFSDFVLWFYDAPLPEANPPAIALRNMRTLAARTYAKANGIRKGVVHINCPFRKPLEPDENDHVVEPSNLKSIPSTKIFSVRPHAFVHDDMTWLRQVVSENEKGIIICGGGLSSNAGFGIYPNSNAIGYPVLAETYSNIRHPHLSLGAYDFYIEFAPKPNVIIHFGDVPLSKELNQFIASSDAEYIFHFDESGVWSDDSHLVTHEMPLSPSIIMSMFNSYDRSNSVLSTQYSTLEKNTWEVIDHEIETGAYFDGAVVYDVVDLIPDESTLFAGNSLPVRHLDQFGKPTNKRIYAYANRGASGIDGNISTALGTGAARPDKPLVAILGDITFYHDMNGLLAVHRCGVPITIVLLNNDGGGIFHRLPISQHDPEFTDYFVTAHGLDYSHSAKLYGLEYIRAGNRDEFRQAFTESVTNRTSMIIEVRTDAQEDLKRRNDIVSAVHERLKQLDL
jgi:2-succinyl-5-enolpyruvyl-6-hydroxy-3-cyclohexene-1-carboxylate synthase